MFLSLVTREVESGLLGSIVHMGDSTYDVAPRALVSMGYRALPLGRFSSAIVRCVLTPPRQSDHDTIGCSRRADKTRVDFEVRNLLGSVRSPINLWTMESSTASSFPIAAYTTGPRMAQPCTVHT
jgi:hypothetical protein